MSLVSKIIPNTSCFQCSHIRFHTGSSQKMNYDINDSPKIVGGHPTDISQVPWQVSIAYSDTGHHFCGGVIIGRYKILTAAHCFTPAEEIIVRIGSTYRSNGGFLRRVAQFIRHENFGNPSTLNNDIAIIILTYPIIYGRKIQPVALPPANSTLSLNSTFIVSGWGIEDADDNDIPEHLLSVQMPYVDQEVCAQIHNGTEDWDIQVTNAMFCTGFMNEGGKDSCQVFLHQIN